MRDREYIAVSSWRLCVIVDVQHLRGRSPEEAARGAIAGGATAIQLRDKVSSGAAFYQASVAVQSVCRGAGIPFIVNDRVDIAMAADADGAHVGQDDLPAPAARRLLGPDRILGVSAGNVVHAARAEAAGADYLGVGPIFEARTTKPDAAPPIGLPGLSAICRAVSLPVIAIGGINAANIRSVYNTGTVGAAVISAVLSADDIAEATRKLMAEWKGSRR